MNISLPESLEAFVDEQVRQRGYGTSSEYVRELIRRDQDRLQVRNVLLTGASSAPTGEVDGRCFQSLREGVCVRGVATPAGRKASAARSSAAITVPGGMCLSCRRPKSCKAPTRDASGA